MWVGLYRFLDVLSSLLQSILSESDSFAAVLLLPCLGLSFLCFAGGGIGLG